MRSVSTAIQRQYDEYYGSARLEKWRQLGAIDKVNNILALCSEVRHDSILDIGCGDGAVLQRLDAFGVGTSYCGLEISTSALEVARSRAVTRLKEVKQFNGYEIPYEDEEFDLAILTHVIEHVEHSRRLLYEAGRVAYHVFVEVPLELTVRLSRDHVPDAVGNINFYSDKTVRRLLQTSDFDVIAQILTDDSKELLIFQYGSGMGLIRHTARQIALNIFPTLGKYVFVYNSALLAKKSA